MNQIHPSIVHRPHMLGFLFCILALLLLLPRLSTAAAWTLPADEISTYHSTFYYSTDRFFDESHQRQKQPTFVKYEQNLYAEYGWYDDITLGMSASVDAVKSAGNAPRHVDGWNNGLSDPSLFARYRLWHDDQTVLSLQPLIKLPSFYRTRELARGGAEQIDIELRLLAGHSLHWRDQYHFLNLEAAYRARLEQPNDQLRVDLSAGYRLDDSWMVMPQLFTTWRLDVPDTTRFTQNAADDFTLIKPQLSVIYSYSDQTSLQFGGFHHSYGQNTGAGGGLFMSLWYRL